LITIGAGPVRAPSPTGGVMRYIIAWALGVPGILIVLWFLMAHH
jgi:hypothetical protein